MHLLNCKTYQLEEFVGNYHPPYAILSHTWDKEELSFIEIQKVDQSNVTRKAGFAKIQFAAEQAEKDGLGYIWADTCCIDKSSSHALSEAINSMFKYYERAAVCYAYLLDVSVDDPVHPTQPTKATLEQSRWFTRGWTLQELIAPANVEFYSREWVCVGRKKELVSWLSTITGILPTALQDYDPIKFSAAQIMSWAASRSTTREEDQAYSLLGLFGAHIPMLYGEGRRAFQRLQEEILRNNQDTSILAWTPDDTDEQFTRLSGPFAPYPGCFKRSSRFAARPLKPTVDPIVVTSRGIRAFLFIIPVKDDVYQACLDCAEDGIMARTPAIYINRMIGPSKRPDNTEARFKDCFVRSYPHLLPVVSGSQKLKGSRQEINLMTPNSLPGYEVCRNMLSSYFIFRSDSLKIDFALPDAFWDPELDLLQLKRSELDDDAYEPGAFCVVTGDVFIAVVVGLESFAHSDQDQRPWCALVVYNQVDLVKEAVASYCTTGRETIEAYMKMPDIGWISAQVLSPTLRGMKEVKVELKAF